MGTGENTCWGSREGSRRGDLVVREWESVETGVTSKAKVKVSHGEEGAPLEVHHNRKDCIKESLRQDNCILFSFPTCQVCVRKLPTQ